MTIALRILEAMKPYLVLIAILCVLLTGCKKEKAGKRTVISGRFYDEVNQEPYKYLKLRVGEFKSRSGFPYQTRYTLLSYLDSTTTDNEGNYRIAFTTTGAGNAYFLEFFDVPQKVTVRDSGSTNYYDYRAKKIEGIGSSIKYNFTISSAYYMRLAVSVHDNPHPPLMMGTSANRVSIYTDRTNVYDRNKDTVVVVPIIKSPNGFQLSFYIKDAVSQKYYRNPDILLNQIIDRDTIDGGHLDVYPSTFQ